MTVGAAVMEQKISLESLSAQLISGCTFEVSLEKNSRHMEMTLCAIAFLPNLSLCIDEV